MNQIRGYGIWDIDILRMSGYDAALTVVFRAVHNNRIELLVRQAAMPKSIEAFMSIAFAGFIVMVFILKSKMLAVLMSVKSENV